MREFEGNKVLHKAFPDILWGMDTRQSPKWSEDDGLIVRRKSNPPEATIEAWGLVDGQPTSKHFKVLLYDDIVVEGSVTTPEMIEKTMKALEQSYNLSNESFVRRFAGTRWHFNDAYRTVIDRGTAVPREHPGTIDGTEYGDPVFWTKESILEKRRDMGPHTFAAQILLNPKADSLKGFKREWLRYYSTAPTKTNNYILIDAASSKKKGSDYTAMWVVGLGTDGNYYALDIIRDRLSLTERTERLFALHRKWKPLQVRYEKYGAMADIEHIKTEQEKQQYRFDITEVGGQTSKVDRIGRLIPVFEQGKFYLPKTLHVTNYEKVTVDLVHTFIEQEYMPFPVGVHDDMADSLARLLEPDLKLVWPKEEETRVRPKVHVVHRGWR
jgi:predicted phage terminase large subunit-like protein